MVRSPDHPFRPHTPTPSSLLPPNQFTRNTLALVRFHTASLRARLLPNFAIQDQERPRRRYARRRGIPMPVSGQDWRSVDAADKYQRCRRGKAGSEECTIDQQRSQTHCTQFELYFDV